MAPSQDSVAATLVDLIEILKDGQIGYRTASEHAKGPMAGLFDEFSSQRAGFAEELRAIVRSRGGAPESADTASRALHRGWMILRSAGAWDADDLLAAVLKGEAEALRAYATALGQELPADVRGRVEDQYRHIWQTSERVRTLQVESRNLQDIGAATEGAPD